MYRVYLVRIESCISSAEHREGLSMAFSTDHCYEEENYQALHFLKK